MFVPGRCHNTLISVQPTLLNAHPIWIIEVSKIEIIINNVAPKIINNKQEDTKHEEIELNSIGMPKLY